MFVLVMVVCSITAGGGLVVCGCGVLGCLMLVCCFGLVLIAGFV